MPTDKIFGLFFFYCVNDFAKILVHLHIHPVITFVNFDGIVEEKVCIIVML